MSYEQDQADKEAQLRRNAERGPHDITCICVACENRRVVRERERDLVFPRGFGEPVRHGSVDLCTKAERELIEASLISDQCILDPPDGANERFTRALQAVIKERRPKTPEQVFEADIRTLRYHFESYFIRWKDENPTCAEWWLSAAGKLNGALAALETRQRELERGTPEGKPR